MLINSTFIAFGLPVFCYLLDRKKKHFLDYLVQFVAAVIIAIPIGIFIFPGITGVPIAFIEPAFGLMDIFLKALFVSVLLICVYCTLNVVKGATTSFRYIFYSFIFSVAMLTLMGLIGFTTQQLNASQHNPFTSKLDNNDEDS